MSKPHFVIERLIPLYEVNLISGPSGAGKTTFMLQMAYDWCRGEDVLGHKSFPADFCFVACDRSESSLRARMDLLEMDIGLIPHCSLIGRTGLVDHTVEGMIKEARRVSPQLDVIFADGFASLCPGRINDAKDVSLFLRQTTKLLHDERITLIATVCAGKTREGQGYNSPRDRIAGSSAWSACTSTKLMLDFTDLRSFSDYHRVLYIGVPDLPARSMGLLFSGPQLIESEEVTLLAGMDEWLESLEAGYEFTTKDAVDQGEAAGHSKRKIEYWLSTMTRLSSLTHPSKGKYVVPPKWQPSLIRKN